MFHLLATSVTTARWEVLASLAVAVLALLGMIWRTARKATLAVITQLDATRANTVAIKELSSRIDHMEKKLT